MLKFLIILSVFIFNIFCFLPSYVMLTSKQSTNCMFKYLSMFFLITTTTYLIEEFSSYTYITFVDPTMESKG